MGRTLPRSASQSLGRQGMGWGALCSLRLPHQTLTSPQTPADAPRKTINLLPGPLVAPAGRHGQGAMTVGLHRAVRDVQRHDQEAGLAPFGHSVKLAFTGCLLRGLGWAAGTEGGTARRDPNLQEAGEMQTLSRCCSRCCVPCWGPSQGSSPAGPGQPRTALPRGGGDSPAGSAHTCPDP